MKPRLRFLAPAIFGTPLKYGVPVIAGFGFFISGLSAHGGDILRGGAPSARGNPRKGAGIDSPTPAATDAARANARDSLARTTRALDAVRAMQVAARNAAKNGPNHLGANPLKPVVNLPKVPNGLVTGGLKISGSVTTDPSQWKGANLPTQTVSKGRTKVTIQQTEQQALLNWETFNVGKKTTVTFDQSKGGENVGQWIAFNKISDPSANPTQILGNIKADGQVYLINSNGIIFGGSSQVNARSLTASALPINDSLIERGLLNNPDSQFLFDGLGSGKIGDIRIEAGATITSKVGADGNGGRVLLAGANIFNAGTISTPNGQTILAAGLQVGLAAHASKDPSLRGLDVYVGAIKDPASSEEAYAGTASNTGLIEAELGNITITGKDVNQLGFLESSTSVALNGSVNLNASYGAVKNPVYDSSNENTGSPFNLSSTGTVTFGEGSVTRILPEYASKDKTTGTELALRSRIEVTGKNIHMTGGSEILAPSARVSFNAGEWKTLPSGPAAFLNSTGQIYLDSAATINLAGTTDATASVLQNYLTVTLRGSELSVAPLQRDGKLRGNTIVVDITKTGTYNGREWVGTPLADVSGYLGIIERDISQLTTAGGTLDLSAGSSVVVRDGAVIDVSGGWTKFTGDTVQTTRLMTKDGRLVDISEARPDQVYSGIFSGTSTIVHEKWGVIDVFQQALAPTGQRYQAGFIHGSAGGSISISTPTVALDGSFRGNTVAGPYQNRSGPTSSNLPAQSSLTLKLQAQVLSGSSILTHSPGNPTITFGKGSQVSPGDFVLDANGDAAALPTERQEEITLAPNLLSQHGFGNLTLINEGGDIILPEDVTLSPANGGSISLTAANIDVLGKIISPGSSLSITTLNLTSYEKELLTDNDATPAPNIGRGLFTLGSKAVLDVAGSLMDERLGAADSPISLNGGSVKITAYSADLQRGSLIDVSGGFHLSPKNVGTHGSGGLIQIAAGKDPGKHTVLGGTLTLNSTLRGFSGTDGGSLHIEAPRIQIGGSSDEAGTLVFAPNFFNQGGFANFQLTGYGIGSSPGVLVKSGTTVRPKVASREAVIDPETGALRLIEVTHGRDMRETVNLTLSSSGIRDLTTVEVGDVIVESGSVIHTDPGGTVKITGNLVSIDGTILTPGGSISAAGGSTSVFGTGLPDPRVTTHIGSQAVLSAAGTVVLTPDAYGRRTGKVLAGGSITLGGNLSVSTGAILDVSGTSGILDVVADTVTPAGNPITPSNGLINVPGGLHTVPVRVDSDGGSIILKGGELLRTDGTLVGLAGGKTALGGSLSISSGIYDSTGIGIPASTVSLTVTNSGTAVDNALGATPGNAGLFAVDTFDNGGFDSLALDGVVAFDGPVRINARRDLSVASNGFLYANDKVELNAGHITIGKSQPVVLPENEKSPFTGSVLPSSGDGRLIVRSGLIDVGHLSLQQIGSASLVAVDGDVRGSGTFQIAGDLTIRAGQIHPNTASELNFIAYDSVVSGSIHIVAAGERGLPLSAGGTLGIYASNILQEGTLRAPFGTINLGWDGTGTPPVDILAGSGAASLFPVTKTLTLGSKSETSVSAIDPFTGKGVTIPYGISTDGENWIDPRGVDITTGGVPEKSVVISGVDITTEDGSLIDLRGGGDLYAYRWVKGLGGPSDILASSNSFAVIPSYGAIAAPVSEFNAGADEDNAISPYTNNTLKAGDRVYLSGSDNLATGYYTLLPARYALLPGAVLVTPTGGTGSATVELADSSSIVSGYRYNSLNTEREVPELTTRFEIAPSKVVRARAEYHDLLANTFLRDAAENAETTVPRLPTDSGHLVFQSSLSLDLAGSVSSKSISGGRGAAIDISTPLNTFIASAATASQAPAGSIVLDSKTLSSFGAETLLIGGRRTSGADGETITVTSSQLTVDNEGSTLSGTDLILVAKDQLTVAKGSSIKSTGSLVDSDVLRIEGNGLAIRVSQDKEASLVRSGVSAGSDKLSIGGGTSIRGSAIILDSSAEMEIAASSTLDADSYQFHAGRISLMLGNNSSPANGGLVVSNKTLDKIGAASSLELLSYSSIDLYGSGSFGSVHGLADLTLSAGEISASGTPTGTARISAGNLHLANPASAPSASGSGASGNLVFSANTIELGANQVAVNGYDSVTLEATGGITGIGTGTFKAARDLTIASPILTGDAGSIRTITAGGDLRIEGTTGTASVSPGLGAALTLQGANVDVAGDISLPGGALTVNALSGDLKIRSLLDVSGSVRQFKDTLRVANAGSITLSASSGDITLTDSSTLDLSAASEGGNGGNLSISTPAGSLDARGLILGNGDIGGGFSLDVFELPSLSGLSSVLEDSGLTGSRSIRVRSGDVEIDGLSEVRNFVLSADGGDIDVTGTIDASGATGGLIRLSASGDLILHDDSLLTVAGDDFDAAGKGGSITLESGSSLNAVAGSGAVDIRSGSTLDLSVASWVAGTEETPGSSTHSGRFTGKLHIRAPRLANNKDLQVDAIRGEIVGASGILVEGYKLYDLTASGTTGTITSALQTSIRNDSTAYLGAAGASNANSIAIADRLLAENTGLADLLVLAPGVEIVNLNGDLTLGSSSSNTTSDWNLSTYRYGSKSAPGVLTLRASGNLVFNNALSDGFSPTLANSDNTWLWTARLTSQNTLLPVNMQSWGYRLTAGADLAAADSSVTRGIAELDDNAGFLKLGKNATNVSTSTGNSATTASAIANNYQVIRTGGGDISINAGRSVQLLNQFATIYTAGTRVEDTTMGGTFRTPNLNLTGMNSVLGNAQQSYSVTYSMGGGNLSINAGENIEHLTLSGGQLVADSQLQMPTNWLYRRGFTDETGTFGESRWAESASTTWWIDFSNFFQGVGALGGGNVALNAGNNISNVDAVIPTNARMPGYTDSTQTVRTTPSASSLLELGGGNLTVTAGNNLDAGVYYVERGHGQLHAGGSILTNATRSVLTQSNITAGQSSTYTELPTTLFTGKGGFDVSANGDLLLGPVSNPFLLPGGLLNSFWYKTYFSTFSQDSEIRVTSLGGDVTLRTAATLPGGTAGAAIPLLQSWFSNKLLFSTQAASNNKPWLRLNETSVAPFQTLFTLQPGSLLATSFTGDIALTGKFNLSPSPTGTLELLAGGSILGFTPNGIVTVSGVDTTTWGAASVNLSDTDPASIPGVLTPFAYQEIAGTSNSAGLTGGLEFMLPVNRLFAESGSTLGENAILQTKQALHAPILLHKDDKEPARLYAEGGDILGLTLFSPKETRAIAGNDIADIAFYIQNTHASDTSIIASGRHLSPYDSATPQRIDSISMGNAANVDSSALAGDLQISGPGTLQVLAGGNLDLGIGGNNADGTGTGITSIGNARNPYLPFSGADLVVGAGLGPSTSLSRSQINLDGFIEDFVLTPKGQKILDKVAPGIDFEKQSEEDQAGIAIDVFYRILRDAGRAYAKTGNYKTAKEAIKSLFGEGDWEGNILARSRDIRTTSGGGISILAPGGGLSLAETEAGNTLSPPGIITEGGGNISIFANNDVSIGIGRIFTLRGGNEVIYSSKGDIAAGSSSKTVKSAPPTRVLIDPQSASVRTDLSGLATGGGIGVLATVKGVKPGDVDLIAPEGTVDAGDAGIRVSGNLNIAATQVLNAGNISVSGNSAGTPAPVSVGANVGSLTAASASAAATTATTANAQEKAAEQTVQQDEDSEVQSIYTVEVLGYGGSSEDEDEEDEENGE
ncbi:MAG: filamentous hemagglutinin family protein [Verrucomicrobiota bacterium]